MPRCANDADAPALAQYLRELLPAAHLVDAVLPLVPEIRLWLINADYPVGPLPPEVASILMVETAGDYFSFSGDIDRIVAADVLYDRDNLPFPGRFCGRAADVLVADSRDRIAVPDPGEAEWVRHVTLYGAGASWRKAGRWPVTSPEDDRTAR